MSGRDLLLKRRLTSAIDQVARPYPCDEGLALEVQAGLWRLGIPCSDLTPREDVIARLWAMKRSLAAEAGFMGAAPPPAA